MPRPCLSGDDDLVAAITRRYRLRTGSLCRQRAICPYHGKNSKDEIQRFIIAELHTFAQCEKAWGIVVVPIVDDTGVATWTVSRFHRGQSNAYACDRALQRIVPHYQRLYDLAQKH
jgi:hypothetical protein